MQNRLYKNITYRNFSHVWLSSRCCEVLHGIIVCFSCEDAADMKNLEQSKVEAIAHDIEEKLYNLHQDINPKYKNKYRSLVFNLKDIKNQVSSESKKNRQGVSKTSRILH